jgi:hypothetical protein
MLQMESLTKIRGKRMTALERIKTHLNANQGLAFCDDCLSSLLSIRPRQAVQQKTYKLAQDWPYERRAFPCSGCGEKNRLAIRKQLALAS